MLEQTKQFISEGYEFIKRLSYDLNISDADVLDMSDTDSLGMVLIKVRTNPSGRHFT